LGTCYNPIQKSGDFFSSLARKKQKKWWHCEREGRKLIGALSFVVSTLELGRPF
jgi:hypothetical protein